MATTKALALKVLARDGYRCVYCNRKGSKVVALEIVHVTPRSWCGSNDAANLVTACSACNTAKEDCDLVTFCLYLRRRDGANTKAMAARVKAALRRKV